MLKAIVYDAVEKSPEAPRSMENEAGRATETYAGAPAGPRDTSPDVKATSVGGDPSR